MQACGRGRDRAFRSGKDRLVALGIGCFGRALHVGGEGEVSALL